MLQQMVLQLELYGVFFSSCLCFFDVAYRCVAFMSLSVLFMAVLFVLGADCRYIQLVLMSFSLMEVNIQKHILQELVIKKTG